MRMSKTLDKDHVIKNKKRGICSLNTLLETYISDDATLKKANLISYWINDYAKMLSFEDKFIPSRNTTYKRGDILKVNFGFRVGCEYGGLHYAVVLDKSNEHNSPTITVVPLTSNKNTDYKLRSTNVDIGDELYQKLKLKHDTLSANLNKAIDETQKSAETLQETLDILNGLDSESVAIETNPPNELNLEDARFRLFRLIRYEQERLDKLHSEFYFLEKIKCEISKMKAGSIAISNQVTTISKIRIQDPKTSAGVLAGIRLSGESMDLINERIKEFYIF